MKLKKSDYIIIISFIASFIAAFISAAPAVALPQLAKEFNLNNIMQNWVINIFLFTVAITAVPLGKFSGKNGIKKTLNLGLIIFLIGTIITTFANSYITLLIFRAIQAIGTAMIYNTQTSIVVLAVEEKNRGKALGIIISGVYIGLAIAPFISGILTYNFGWRTIFYFTIPFTLIALFLSLSKVKDEWNMYENETYDKIGSILYIIGIFFFIYGFTILNQIKGILFTIIGIIFLFVFVITDLKVKDPIFNLKLFKNKRFSSSNIASLISYIATFVVTYILNYHFQYILNLNSQTTGILLVITPVIMAIISPFSGKFSDKIDSQKLAAIGMSFVTIALFILIFLNKSTPLWIIFIAMILQGLGYGIFSSPNTNMIMSSVPPEETPSASVSITVMRVIGQTMSLAMLTIIFAIIMGDVPIIPKYFNLLTESSQIACIISTILCFIAVIISLIGINEKNEI